MPDVLRHHNPQFAALCDEAEELGVLVELDVGAKLFDDGARTLGPIILNQPKKSKSAIIPIGFGVTLEGAAEKARGHLSKFK